MGMPLERCLVSGGESVWGGVLPDTVTLGTRLYLHFLATGIIAAYDTASVFLN